MQRCSSAYVGAIAALHLVTFASLSTPIAWSTESSWDPSSSESNSTLSAQIAPQQFEVPRSILDLVSPKTASQSLQLVPAQPATPSVKTARAKPSQSSKSVNSPFTKWVSPKSSSDKQAESKPAEVAKTTRPLENPATPSKPATPPKVARRILSRSRSSSSSRTPKASPQTQSTKSQNTSKSSRKTISAKPLPIESFPTPKAEHTSKPIQLDPANLPPLTSSQKNLRTKVRRVLAHYYARPLNTRDRGPWEVMHSLLSYEVDSKLLVGGPKGKETSAVGWLCFNQTCKRRTLMYVSDEGEMRVRVGPALQGHRGQLLAMLAQSKVSKDYPIQIQGHEFKVADLVKMEMKTCYPRTELTFKLIGLMHYLDSDTTWMNDQGMEWNISRLISEELRQPVRGAACGGTHRLSGLTLTYKTRLQRGEPVDGEYLKAKNFVRRYQRNAYRLQNRDGSLSTEWFRGPGNENSIDRKLKTTGHLLEWLLYASTEKELKHSQTTRAANYLATIMYNNRYKDWEAGPLGHAIHALLVYDRMMFSPYDALENLPVAKKQRRSTTTSSKR